MAVGSTVKRGIPEAETRGAGPSMRGAARPRGQARKREEVVMYESVGAGGVTAGAALALTGSENLLIAAVAAGLVLVGFVFVSLGVRKASS